jgi:tRNA threonylcarbamoyladenosine biosynthesis protein TsaB
MVSNKTDEQPIILSVDTTSDRGSVALHHGSRLTGLIGIWSPATHSKVLHEELDLLLTRAGTTIGDVSLFAVCVGPGSFTGVRVGIASIKGLAHTLDKPVAAVSTLEALAHAVGLSGTLCCCIDALRGETYTQLFRVAHDGTITPLTEPTVLAPKALVESLVQDDLIIVADGTGALSESIETEARAQGIAVTRAPKISLRLSGWLITEAGTFLAASIGALGLAKYESGQAVSASALEALYVRPSDAEVRRRLRESGSDQHRADDAR